MTDFALEYDFQIDLICLFFKLLNHTRISFSQILALHYSLAYIRSAFRSCTGAYIASQEQLAICSSWLHPSNRSRNILLGHDGRETQTGAICSNCDSWHTTICIAFGIIGLGVLAGLCKAAGMF